VNIDNALERKNRRLKVQFNDYFQTQENGHRRVSIDVSHTERGFRRKRLDKIFTRLQADN
jgi:hypothetical protein